VSVLWHFVNIEGCVSGFWFAFFFLLNKAIIVSSVFQQSHYKVFLSVG